MKNTKPVYNLNVIIRETGIKPDTLRAWERRYGLPQPSRTEGGHRLYSERDISMIHWLNERLEEGLRIKQAVDLWKEMEAAGQDPLIVRPIIGQLSSDEKGFPGESPTLNELRQNWIEACLDFDENSAESIASLAFALYPIETVCFEVLLGGLAEIGDSWYQGEVSVQQEHFTSSLVIRRLDALIGATPAPTRPGTIITSCSPGEEHVIPPLMLTLLLRQRGWRVVYLGANVPQSYFEETIHAINPLMVVITAQHLKSAASLLGLARYLFQHNIKVAFGGLIFNRNPGLSAVFPGYFLGVQLESAIPRLEEILTTSPPVPQPPPKSTDYQEILAYFLEMRPQIEAEVAKKILQYKIDSQYLLLAERFLGEDIEAALRIGNLDLLLPELDWITVLTKNYQVEPGVLRQYLAVYYEAAESILDARGDLITRWFGGMLENLEKGIT